VYYVFAIMTGVPSTMFGLMLEFRVRVITDVIWLQPVMVAVVIAE